MAHLMARRKLPESKPPAPAGAAAPRVPMAVWVNDKFVCVNIIDSPAAPCDGVCRCPACHDGTYADLAARFYPDR